MIGLVCHAVGWPAALIAAGAGGSGHPQVFASGFLIAATAALTWGLTRHDRGEHAVPRYAVIDGQHRWAAAGYRKCPDPLVANVHTGLTVADEAALFDKLNRQRKQTGTWDHWKARRSAQDAQVLAIEQTVAAAGLRVTDVASADGAVSCIGTLEKIASSAGGLDLLGSTLTVITSAWGRDQRSAFEAPLIHGLAMALATFADRIDAPRLIDALGGQPPKRIRLSATTMRDAGMQGSLAKLTAVAIVNHYNQTAGKRLTWPTWWKGVLPKPARVPTTAAQQARQHERAQTQQPAATTATAGKPDRRWDNGSDGRTESNGHTRRSNLNAPALNEITSEHSGPRTMPGAVPRYASDDELADAVASMEGKSVAEIASALGIPERTVRRIHADLGVTA